MLYQAKFGERIGILRFAMTYNYLHLLREPAYNFDINQYPAIAVRSLVDPTASPDTVDIKGVFKN